MNIKQALVYAKENLADKSESPMLDAELLLSYVLAESRAHLHAWPEKVLTLEQTRQFETCLKRRIGGEPVSYVTGTKEFWSLNFKVTRDTLIPRPETELLVETVLRLFPENNQLTLADLGTGSGAVAIALAYERPRWQIHATDINPQTLAIATENAAQFNIKNISFHIGSWLSALPVKKFDVIVSNPPYISEQEWQHFQNGLAHEPVSALLSENEGLADVEEIMSSADKYLEAGGYLILEHGYEQGDKVRQLFASYGYKSVETVRDLAGHERVSLGRYNVVCDNGKPR